MVREVRANLLARLTPSEAAIVDAVAARGVEVARSYRRDIDVLRGAAAVLLSETRARWPKGCAMTRRRSADDRRRMGG